VSERVRLSEHRWVNLGEPHSRADLHAFQDALLIDKHFGFPYADVFSKAASDEGRINVHKTRTVKTRLPRPHYLSNLLGIRFVKQQQPLARIWDERYEFNYRIKHGIEPYDSFRAAFGEDRLREIYDIARKRGIRMGPHREFMGKPDMAVYYSCGDFWRFIEVKHDRTGEIESWRPYQTDWLQLLAEYLGPQSAVELRFTDE
jgi:hypothetical protein